VGLLGRSSDLWARILLAVGWVLAMGDECAVLALETAPGLVAEFPDVLRAARLSLKAVGPARLYHGRPTPRSVPIVLAGTPVQDAHRSCGQSALRETASAVSRRIR